MDEVHHRRIAVAGGFTAGHVLAGLAFLKAYREEYGASGCFIGCAGGIETRLVPAHNVELNLIAGSPYARQGWSGRVASLWNLAQGVFEARRLLRRKRIELVIGVGAYASVGAGLAARSLGIPLVIHEANAEPGLANRLLARFADRVCVGYEETVNAFPGCTVEYVGNPGGVHAPASPRPVGRPMRFLVAGGSLGSPFLNREAPRLFGLLSSQDVAASVMHLAGEGDVEAIRRAYAEAGVPAQVRTFVDKVAEAYADTDFVIACPGALTLAEIAAAGLPSLLVPLAGAADDHQSANARLAAERTGAAWVTEEEWNTAREAAWLAALARDPARLAESAERARASAWPDAARRFVRTCESVLEARASE